MLMLGASAQAMDGMKSNSADSFFGSPTSAAGKFENQEMTDREMEELEAIYRAWCQSPDQDPELESLLAQAPPVFAPVAEELTDDLFDERILVPVPAEDSEFVFLAEQRMPVSPVSAPAIVNSKISIDDIISTDDPEIVALVRKFRKFEKVVNKQPKQFGWKWSMVDPGQKQRDRIQKNLVCEFCGRTAATPFNLKRHMHRKHGAYRIRMNMSNIS